MLSVGIGVDEAMNYIREASYENIVEIACHNSPGNTTISGDREAIEKLKETFDAKNIFARVLRTGGKAYHSHHMREAGLAYKEYLDQEPTIYQRSLPKCPMYSTTQTEATTSVYGIIPNSRWVKNLTGRVLFDEGVSQMLVNEPSVNTLIEIGPHSVLEGPLRQICQARNKSHMSYLPTLKRNGQGVDELLSLAGHLWAKGASIDIRAVTGFEKLNKDGAVELHTGSLLVDLPTYRWTYTKSYRSDSRLNMGIREAKEQRHDILGRRVVASSSLAPVWRNVLRQRDLPW